MSKHTKPRRAETVASEQRDGLKTGNETLVESATCNDSTIAGADPDRLAKALLWLAYGATWRFENRPAWSAFDEYAEQCIAEGKPLSPNALHAIIKRKDYTNVRTGATTRLNRTATPLFARWLLREHPGLKAELRRSFFDVLFPYEEVGR